jgi:hypothetical protein
MSRPYRMLPRVGPFLVALFLLSAPLAAQGNGKRYAVTHDRALVVTREVLVKQGFHVVRVDVVGATQIVYYRRGNQGKGKGKGKLEKLVIRREADRIIFDDTPSALLVAIDIKLRL